MAGVNGQNTPDDDFYIPRGKRSAATLSAYRNDWRSWEIYAALQGYEAIPAPSAAIAAYIKHLAKAHRVSTINRHLATISVAHKHGGHPSPTASQLVKDCLFEVRRELKVQPRKKKELIRAAVRKMVDGLPCTLAGKRDRALLLIGFWSAMRRGELARLNRDDLDFSDKGVLITVRQSKTDQEGEGEEIGVPYMPDVGECAVTALRDWLKAAGIKSGPVFRPVDRHGNIGGRMQARTVATIVKRHASRIGFDADQIGAHSLRSGYITSCCANGVPEADTMATSRHKSIQVFRGYNRRATVWTSNSGIQLGRTL